MIVILNGPNLNLLGVRQPEIYGSDTLDQVIDDIKEKYSQYTIIHLQSNHEGVLIDKLHEYGFDAQAIILNAGGYTHTSIALGDAVKAISSPVIEVHISDISNREDYRKYSYIKEGAAHSIIGQGIKGYGMAVEWVEKNISV